jgi:hypothetical protein
VYRGPRMASAAGQKRGAAEMAAGGSGDEAPWSTSFTVRVFLAQQGILVPASHRPPCRGGAACTHRLLVQAARSTMCAMRAPPMRLPCSCMPIEAVLLLLLSRCRSCASRTSAR